MKDRYYISIGNNMEKESTVTDLQFEIRRLESTIESLTQERDNFKELAKGLYDYYYLNEGHSSIVGRYQATLGDSPERA